MSYYTEAYCKAKKIAYRKQTELAAQLIRQLRCPGSAVVVLGDTAFDAKAIRTACEERKFSWIVPSTRAGSCWREATSQSLVAV